MAKKVLNLSGSRKPQSPATSSASSSDAESSDNERQPQQVETNDASGSEESEDEDDEEFEIPPGFESVKGSSSITRESILSGDKELWFFKLPKHLDASALANASFKLGSSSTAGTVLTSVSADGKKYSLHVEDPVVTNQLVNAFPQAKDRAKFTLGKPFSRCFSLVEDRSQDFASSTTPASEPVAPTKSKKHSKSDSDKPAKKAKTTK